jgi:hypothetical protein
MDKISSPRAPRHRVLSGCGYPGAARPRTPCKRYLLNDIVRCYAQFVPQVLVIQNRLFVFVGMTTGGVAGHSLK